MPISEEDHRSIVQRLASIETAIRLNTNAIQAALLSNESKQLALAEAVANLQKSEARFSGSIRTLRYISGGIIGVILTLTYNLYADIGVDHDKLLKLETQFVNHRNAAERSIETLWDKRNSGTARKDFSNFGTAVE